MREKDKIASRLFLLRFGITILALLTLHGLVTVYKQLGEASQILDELTEAGTIPSNFREENFKKQPKYTVLPKYSFKTESNHAKNEFNPHLKGRGTIRTRIRENIFTYQRFYESDDTVSRMPTQFMQMNQSIRAQIIEKYQNTQSVARRDKMTNILRNKRKRINIQLDKITNDNDRPEYEAKNISNNNNERINTADNHNKDSDKNRSNIDHNDNDHNNKKNKRNSNDDENIKEKKKNDYKNDNNDNHTNKTNSGNNDSYKNNKNITKDNKNTIIKNNDNINESKSKSSANNRSKNDEKKSKAPDLRAKVMILAYRRSGSSFLGEMFNRNPRVFYLFESLYPVEGIAGGGKLPLLYDTLVGHILDVIYTCSFNKHSFLVNFLSDSPFRLKSEALRKPGLCTIDVHPDRILRQCKPLNHTTLRTLCNSKDHIVVKTIRASSKKTFEYFAGSRTQDPSSYTLNVIHLVRDPRAIISSRLHLYLHRQLNISAIRLQNDQNLTNALRRSVRVASANLCSRIYSDLKYGQQAGPNAYMQLRYEDAAMQPLKTYGLVSKFSGIQESEEVKIWLRRNTNVADTHDANDEYSTSRNSTASVYGWRRVFPFKLVREVQSQCGEVMNMLGYLPARSQRELMDIKKILVNFDHVKRDFSQRHA